MDTSILVNGRHKLDWEKGLTINKVLEKLNFTYKLLIVKINGKIIKKDQYKTCRVPPGADIKVIHLMSGG